MFLFAGSRFLSSTIPRILPLPSRRALHFQSYGGLRNRLSTQQIDYILRLREASSVDGDPPPSPVKSFEASQLAANFPIEDRCFEARLLRTGGMLFATIDGHSGPDCAQALSERLADYVSVALMDGDSLQRLSHEMDESAAKQTPFPALIKQKLHPGDYVLQKHRENHIRQLRAYMNDCLEVPSIPDIPTQLRDAFVRLDHDISSTGLETLNESQNGINYESLANLAVALSGAVVCAAYVNDCDLYIASTGDSYGIIAGLDEEGQWVSRIISANHSIKNKNEVDRIYREHPEEPYVIAGERLLGMLLPFRAFGDCHFKWPAEKIKAILKRYELMHLFPHVNVYKTPPYVTAEPEITHVHLHPNDKFMLLCSDGLFDYFNEKSAAELVIEHMSGRRALQPFKVNPGATLAELNVRLKKRVLAQTKKPDDPNVATHIIRHALGRTDIGLDIGQLSRALEASTAEARQQRDDITVQVVFFDTEYLRLFSPMDSGARAQ